MCTEVIIKKLIAAAVIAVGFWVFISAFIMQFVTADITYSQNTLQIISRYFVGMVVMGIGKHIIIHSNVKSHDHANSKPAKKRRR